jgi:excisionase family DNA binding protein
VRKCAYEDLNDDEQPLGKRGLLLRVDDAAQLLAIGRTTMYQLIAAGEIELVHIGRCARVPVSELERYVERCRAQRAAAPRQTL